MSKPGELTAAELMPVQGSIQLGNGAGQSFLRVHKAKSAVTIAGPYGGYRWASLQNAMRAAGEGHDAAAKRKYGLDTSSVVSIAAHPYGTHEDGTSADLVGFPITDAWLDWLESYGWTRPFGPRDPRHFHYDQKLDRHRPVASAKVHTVVRGDTAGAIAKKAGISLAKLDKLNDKLSGPKYTIFIGEKLALA